MKILHCADIHLGCVPNGLEERREDFFLRFNELARAALEGRADVMLIAGDLFHQRSIDSLTLRRAQEQLALLKAGGVRVIAVEGNHDKALYSHKQSWLEYLDWAGLITLLKPVFDGAEPVLSEYRAGAGCVLTIGDVRFVGLGYLGGTTRTRVQALLNALPPFDGLTAAILHTGVDRLRGLDMGAMLGTDLEGVRGAGGYVALGHVHARYENGFYFNPGAPEVVHINEAMRGEKGYYWIETQGKAFRTEFVPTAHRKVHCVHVSPQDTIERIRDACAGVRGEDMLQVRVLGNAQGAFVNVAAIKEALEDAYAPLYCEVLDLTDAPDAADLPESAQAAQLEREVFRQMAQERGLFPNAGDVALMVCDALLEEVEPPALYAMIEENLPEEESV